MRVSISYRKISYYMSPPYEKLPTFLPCTVAGGGSRDWMVFGTCRSPANVKQLCAVCRLFPSPTVHGRGLIRKLIRKLSIFPIFSGDVFPKKNLVWTQFWSPGTWKFGFLVENYVYSLIPRNKLANQGQNTSKLAFCVFFSVTIRVLKLWCLAFSGGPEGFRKLQGPGRNHFHLSWYLLVPGITSYSQKPWGETFSFVAGMVADFERSRARQVLASKTLSLTTVLNALIVGPPP